MNRLSSLVSDSETGEVAGVVSPEGAMRKGAKYALARRLRSEMSKPEVDLWVRLRDRSEGFSFRRQHPIGPYVADFYCACARLIIEVDGEAHEREDRPRRDAARDAYFCERGIETMRIPATDILADADDIADGVLRYVRERLDKGMPPPA